MPVVRPPSCAIRCASVTAA